VELRKTFDEVPDLKIVYVIPDNQWNDKSTRFVESFGMRDRILFAVDPGSQAVDQLGVRREDPEAIEEGVPHPATFLIDRGGVVRFADVREDFHVWVDSEFLREALDAIP
jgi:peroxiredoxin